ncbi:MAG: ABC transporter ATP-binding protein [Candidatus Methanoperedens sp.]|nr:ABC transporter ATP-binding protein [Candidatus Methanoperedens sp.]MCZ7361000.1 ABC transporter ATP-binding protein [Candidatus Methanoperedens sp.]HLB69885.1 ABC transporter ATP-binding protein [Candidatus Methanoperedens sp.]
MPLIKTVELSKTYWQDETRVHALDNINLSIEQGEFVAITGPSGSGKSTLLHILGCIDAPTRGRVLIKDVEVSKMNEGSLSKLRLHELGFVFQQFYLLPTLTAYENIELPLLEAGVPKKIRKGRIMELLGAVGLNERAKHRPGQLSGGEQQRVAIARALANNPAIILADEPTGELDSANGRNILELLVRINREYGKTLIVVTHDESIARHAGRVIKLRDGRIINDVC